MRFSIKVSLTVILSILTSVSALAENKDINALRMQIEAAQGPANAKLNNYFAAWREHYLKQWVTAEIFQYDHAKMNKSAIEWIQKSQFTDIASKNKTTSQFRILDGANNVFWNCTESISFVDHNTSWSTNSYYYSEQTPISADYVQQAYSCRSNLGTVSSGFYPDNYMEKFLKGRPADLPPRQ